MKKSLVDSGPLIALFDKSDKYHKTSLKIISEKNYQLYTTWPVITEVSHLLGFNIETQINFIEWIDLGGLKIFNLYSQDLQRIIELSKKYSDLPMDLADASLVAVSERESMSNIFSYDKDFGIYRYRKGCFTNIWKS